MAKPVILLAFANDREDQRRYLDELQAEQVQLDDLLSEQFNVEQKPVATLERIQQAFNAYGARIRVFHFGGHANAEQIELARGKDGHQGGYVAGVAKFIGLQKGVELVFLNGCSTEGQVSHFKQSGIPAVIATTAPINDKVAREFASLFYRAFALSQFPKSLQQAFEEAQAQLSSRYPSFEAIYTRSLEVGEVHHDPSRFPYELHLRSTRAGQLTYADLCQVEEEESVIGPVPPLAYLLCDRDDQHEGFDEAIRDSLREPQRHPLAYLVHGEENELPLRLCDRLFSFSLAETFRRLDRVLEPSRYARYAIDLPRERDFKRPHKAWDRVKESFHHKLELDHIPIRQLRDLKAEDIVAHLGQHYKVIFFQHNLYAEAWDPKHMPDFLAEYLGEFWNLNLPEGSPDIFLVFSLQHAPRKGLLARLRGSDDKLAESFAAISVVLEKLIPVPRLDVKRWNDKYAADDPNLTDQLFQGKKELPMQSILPILKSAVDRNRR